jgi:hypothetical protein
MRACMIACMTWALAACGGDDHPPAFASSGKAERDAGERDAAARVPLDAGGFQHVIHSGDLELCGFDDSDALELEGNAEQTELAMSTDEQRFALVFHDADGALLMSDIAVEGAAGDPKPIVEGETGAALLAASGQHRLLAYRGAADAGAVLSVVDTSTSTPSALELSHALASSADGGEPFALLGRADGFLVAYAEQAGKAIEVRLQRIAFDGTAEGDAVGLDGVGERAPEDLHLAQLDRGSALLAWFERDATGHGRIMGLTLSSALAASGEPVELSKYAVEGGRFDLAARSRTAGLLYHAKDGETRDTVKYRRVDGDGQVTEAAFNVVNAPGRALGGSIAAFGQGYAVAYRELPSLGVDHAAVHVAFINQFGAIVYDAELAATSETGGRTTLTATEDGHLLVGWTNQTVPTPTTHAYKLYCPGALVLCGG